MLEHDIGDHQAAARFEHPEGFPENPLFGRGQVDHAVGDDDIDLVVRHREVLDLSQAEFHVREIPLPGISSGLVEHLRGHVDADHLTAFPHLPGGQKTVESRARAKVQDDFAFPEGCERQGISAPEPQVRPLRNRRKVLVGVPNVFADHVRFPAPAAGRLRPAAGRALRGRLGHIDRARIS